MAQATLSKALKLKNRQAQKVNELRRRITGSNSYLAGSTPDFDATQLIEELEVEAAKLWKLKAAINAANIPIHALLYEAAEIRGTISWLQGLDSKQGLQAVMYMAQEPQEYIAQLDAQTIAARIEAKQKRLDDIQDELDAHNATTKIEVDL